jgi:hypothetical protein
MCSRLPYSEARSVLPRAHCLRHDAPELLTRRPARRLDCDPLAHGPHVPTEIRRACIGGQITLALGTLEAADERLLSEPALVNQRLTDRRALVAADEGSLDEETAARAIWLTDGVGVKAQYPTRDLTRGVRVERSGCTCRRTREIPFERASEHTRLVAERPVEAWPIDPHCLGEVFERRAFVPLTPEELQGARLQRQGRTPVGEA